MSLGKKLRDFREKLNKSQLTVASDLQISNAQLSRYEADARKPQPELIRKFAEYFGTTTDYLLGNTDISIPDTKISPEEQIQFEAFINNPEYGLFIKEFLGASEFGKSKLMDYWQVVKQAEEFQKLANKLKP